MKIENLGKSDKDKISFDEAATLNAKELRQQSKSAYPATVTNVLEAWYEVNKKHPYPTKVQKAELAKKTNLSDTQVVRWFENKRVAMKNVVSERHTATATNVLEAWYEVNKKHPYPNNEQKAELVEKTNLSKTQVDTWFKNKRIRAKKKVVSSAGVEDEKGGSLIRMVSIYNYPCV